MQNGEQKYWGGSESWRLPAEEQASFPAEPVGRSKEPGWGDLGLWARHTAFSASQGTGKRILAWTVLTGCAAFVFGFPPLIWCTWEEWDFCRVAHVFSFMMPVYWIYLAVKARQRHDDGERLLQPSDGEVASSFEGWRVWRVRLYDRPTRQKIVDVVVRVAILGALALIFRARIVDNGYFWVLCVEFACRVLLMIKRPAHFADPIAIEPA